MDELTFIASIDCRFPYGDTLRAQELASEACSVSANCAFAVIDEITRPPKGEVVLPHLRESVLSLIEDRLSHPLAKPVVALARRLAASEVISVSESVALLQTMERYPGQHAALSIAYLACDDVDGVADAEFKRIVAAWSAG